MKVSIFGIGYVGAVSAACLAADGNDVTAVDPNGDKVDALNQGRSPIVEPGLDEIIERTIRNGSLRATSDAEAAVHASELSLVCVGTPSRANGSLDTGYVKMACEEIGKALAKTDAFHSVVMRSTILPGTMESLVIPTLEAASGKRAGIDFGIGYYPEFLRESTAIKDYYKPGAIVIGRYLADEKTAERLKALNAHLPTTPVITDVRTAEAVKYTNNCWHAVKISFANEIGNICKAVGIDGHEVMDILCSDTRLNISTAYMKPGFAFGGSCLPKDLRALRYKAREQDVVTPILDAAMAANNVQLDRAFKLVEESGNKRVGMVGLTFKADTDDLRESPLVALAEQLHGKGYDLTIYDPNVKRMHGNGYNRSTIGHLSAFVTDDIDEVMSRADTIVIGNHDRAATKVMESDKDDLKVIDLVRMEGRERLNGQYQGICW
ncbi:nucleotide sugar dehydrogenase [Chthonobacter albigriseus]|uniref:nucleotide sugar dehydrogenase n=1 Tax=Chthonobacter albigriseus TaxID=1683161 RepID=UPI0015EF4658|nr:UDP-glucose/GDP-mannose dehydrogenase family protein [Chthonobacter albigriseus]